MINSLSKLAAGNKKVFIPYRCWAERGLSKCWADTSGSWYSCWTPPFCWSPLKGEYDIHPTNTHVIYRVYGLYYLGSFLCEGCWREENRTTVSHDFPFSVGWFSCEPAVSFSDGVHGWHCHTWKAHRRGVFVEVFRAMGNHFLVPMKTHPKDEK